MLTVETTINPIYRGNQDPDTSELYSNLDAKSLQGEIKAFQEWMIKTHPIFNSDGDIVIVSGIFDDGTKKAFAKYGVEYAAGSPVGKEPTERQKRNAAKRGILWNKVKGWFTKTKQSGLFELGKNQLGLPSEQPYVIGGAPNQTIPPYGSPYTPVVSDDSINTSKKAMLTYVGIGLSILVVGGIIWYASKNNK